MLPSSSITFSRRTSLARPMGAGINIRYERPHINYFIVDSRVRPDLTDAGWQFLEAVERRDGTWTGLRFVLPVAPGEAPPWGEMRARIRAWLARRRGAGHPRSGQLELLARSLRGQIESVADDDGPTVLVDD